MVRIGRVCVPWLVGWKLMLKELERVKPCVDCLPRVHSNGRRKGEFVEWRKILKQW